ncbi:hypothetical protein Aph01nite_76870 [Acrocarpospora phusangensis]|uniref:Uncharacterized protein n=1 Tax=Acrocarpospora phusangensis TaxID=1070424 RepID=A0A919QI49_9ACTN|nr:hypothetical protein Aph01nite_76870 [Acrocarpospora phusangensis]
MEEYPHAEREARRGELWRLSKIQLVRTHHGGSGCLMPIAELRGWTREELVTAILDGEFGPRPSAPQEII